MSSDGSNWDKVDRALEKSRTKVKKTLPFTAETQSGEGKALSPDRPDKPGGVIAQFRASKIGRKVALEKLTAWHEAELQVVKARLTEAVRVHKTEAYFHAEQYLASLETEHRAHLTDLGIRNDSVRNEGAERLLTELTKSLKRLQDGDFPEALREETIQRLIDNYRKSLDKIFHDPAD